jgi:hypothetical protein
MSYKEWRAYMNEGEHVARIILKHAHDVWPETALYDDLPPLRQEQWNKVGEKIFAEIKDGASN